MKFVIFLLLAFITSISWAQSPRHHLSVLFIGNSYVYYNDMPLMLKLMSESSGDSLNIASNTPGGYTLEQHSKDSTTLDLIKKGDWDFVILQEQSQLPSLKERQVRNQFYPFAIILDSIIKKYNDHSKTIFYMTWGRRDGDLTMCNIWKPVCTYDGMDSLIALRYEIIADSCHAVISPVGKVWHQVLRANPKFVLYDSDGGHPSKVGSYLAACCFYTTILNKNPDLITFNSSLTPDKCKIIRHTVKEMVYDDKSHTGINKEH